MPGVKRVARSNWFGGMPGSGKPDFKNFFPNFAVDAEPYFAMYPEIVIQPDQMRAFMDDRRGAVIGRGAGRQVRLEAREHVPARPASSRRTRWAGPFDFVVRAIYSLDEAQQKGGSRSVMFFHYQYLYEATNQRAGVGTYKLQIVELEPGAGHRQGDRRHSSRTAT